MNHTHKQACTHTYTETERVSTKSVIPNTAVKLLHLLYSSTTGILGIGGYLLSHMPHMVRVLITN